MNEHIAYRKHEFEAREPVKVAVINAATGEVLAEYLLEDAFVLVTASRCYLSAEGYPDDATAVLTIRHDDAAR